MNTADFTKLLGNWTGAGATGKKYTDGDGDVDTNDFTILIPLFGQSGGNADFCADFNRYGEVDGTDFNIWQIHVNQIDQCASRAEGDADGDGDVDFEDRSIWESELGGTPCPTCTAGCGQQQAMAGGGNLAAVAAASLAPMEQLDLNRDGDFDEVDILRWQEKLGAEE